MKTDRSRIEKNDELFSADFFRERELGEGSVNQIPGDHSYPQSPIVLGLQLAMINDVICDTKTQSTN